MARITHHVVARFPEHELAIERLVRSSESFKEMCEEYNEGIDALERWQQAARPQAEVAELRDSLADLEAEMLAALQGDAAAGSNRRRRSTGSDPDPARRLDTSSHERQGGTSDAYDP